MPQIAAVIIWLATTMVRVARLSLRCWSGGPPSMIQGIQPSDKIQFDRNAVSDPPRSLVAFVTKLLAEDYKGPQRQAFKRFPLFCRSLRSRLMISSNRGAWPLRRLRETFPRRDFALFSTQAASSKFLAVELTPNSGQDIQVVLQVLRCKLIGRFYEIVGHLVARTGNRPQLGERNGGAGHPDRHWYAHCLPASVLAHGSVASIHRETSFFLVAFRLRVTSFKSHCRGRSSGTRIWLAVS